MNDKRARSTNQTMIKDDSKGPWRPTAVKDTGLEESFMQPVSRETPIKSYVSHTYNASARSYSGMSRGSATKAQEKAIVNRLYNDAKVKELRKTQY